MERLIIGRHIALLTPSVVYYNNIKCETEGLTIKELVSAWRKKFNLTGWLVLALPDDEYKTLNKRPFPSLKSAIELFYENEVICINIDFVDYD